MKKRINEHYSWEEPNKKYFGIVKFCFDGKLKYKKDICGPVRVLPKSYIENILGFISFPSNTC